MKAISLWQPWASAISVGSKQIETRSWKTGYRGPLAIHAAKKWNRRLDALARALYKHGIPLPWDDKYKSRKLKKWLPLGAFVCLVDLVDCVEMTDNWISQQGKTELLLGDYKSGRWGWILKNIRPIPGSAGSVSAKGQQGLWTVSDQFFQIEH